MALDPRLSLLAAQGVADVGALGQGFEQGFNLLQNVQNAPLRRQLLEQQLLSQQQATETAQRTSALAQEQADLMRSSRIAATLKPFVERGDLEGAKAQLPAMGRFGVTQEDMQEFSALLDQGQQGALDAFSVIDSMSQQAGKGTRVIPSSNRRVREGGKVFSEYDVELPGGRITAVRQEIIGETLTRKGLTAQEEAQLDIDKTAGKTSAKLMTELKLKPAVRSAVVKAEEVAKNEVERLEGERSNAQAITIWDTSMNALVEALGGTTTGPVAGWLPAVSSNQQIADGAIAAMAPVLKEIFRGAGEGSFTDADQKILIDMLPTRKDTPEARVAKMRNVDTIVRAKLGQPLQAPPVTQPGSQQPITAKPKFVFNPTTGKVEQQ